MVSGLPVIDFSCALIALAMLAIHLDAGQGAGPKRKSSSSIAKIHFSQPSPSPSSELFTSLVSSFTKTARSCGTASETQGISANSRILVAPKAHCVSVNKIFTHYFFADRPGGDDALDVSGRVIDLGCTTSYTFEA